MLNKLETIDAETLMTAPVDICIKLYFHALMPIYLPGKKLQYITMSLIWQPISTIMEENRSRVGMN